MMERQEEAILEGLIAVDAALTAGSREIRSLLIRQDQKDHAVALLEARARSAGIKVERMASAKIDELVSGKTHGGVVALAGSRRYGTLEELVSGQDTPFVAMLDGIEDPFNFGYAVRSLYAAGASGLVVRPRNWMSAAGVVARASAGASEMMPTAIAETALEAANFYKSRGLTIACAATGNSVSLFEADLSGPLFLVIGGEKRGISRPLLQQADIIVRIPYARQFRRSLGTTSATAVLAFEIMRQRLKIVK